MIRTLAIAVVFAVVSASSANAANCTANFDDYWDKLHETGANLETETLISVQRKALRAFDACQSGDEGNFGDGFWKQMQLYGEIKDPKKFWEDMALYGEAKK